MKVITVFSGKGGVGKSTISALLALELSKKYKTCLLDFDINTPSIPVLFGERKSIKNLDLYSTGFDNKADLFYSQRSSKDILNNLAKSAKSGKYDICIIDMPPGVSEVHNHVMTKLKPSGMICVTQPNNLSKEDTVRAVSMFMSTKIPLLGVIYNMTSKTFGNDNNLDDFLPKLFEINLIDDLANEGNAGNIDKVSNPFKDKTDDIVKKLKSITWELQTLVNKDNNFEGLPLDIVKKMFEERNIRNSLGSRLKDYSFMGLNSWDYIREALNNFDILGDKFLQENNTETIKRTLENFNEDGFGLFIIVKPPCTPIKTISGEVGYGRLVGGDDKDDYYGVPRIAYNTDDGELILFPHEVAPTTIQNVQSLIKEGELLKVNNSKEERWFPTRRVINIINCTFGLSDDWEEVYDKYKVK